MYWSGSGALYDYLREYDEVDPVPGELRLWKEGGFCLSALARDFGDPERFRPALLAFLAKALCGIAPIGAWREVLASRFALAALRCDGDGGYAESCRRFAEEAARLSGAGPGGAAAFEGACSRLSESLVRRWSGYRGGFALLDNAIHIADVGALRLLGDATALCSFRDPRSNFAARWRENPRFHRDAGRFIEYYRATARSFDAALAASPALAARVRRVSFERFILSEEYRDSLARDCGLDPEARRRGSHFKPDASRRNVLNYLDFPDPEAIRRIERELGEYCLDPSSTGEP